MLAAKPTAVFSSTEDEVQVSSVQDKRTKKSPSVSSDSVKVSSEARAFSRH